MSFFPANLRVLRNQLNETQSKIADRLGIKQRTYAAWEEGRSQPDNAMVIKIAKVHNVTINDLVIYDLSKVSLNQSKENLIITRYSLVDESIRGQVDLILGVK